MSFCVSLRCDPQATTPQATTPQATTERATTSQATTAQVTTIQASAAAAPIFTIDQPKNVVGIVFGTMFAVLLLFVIVAAVVLYLHLQGRLPSFAKQAS